MAKLKVRVNGTTLRITAPMDLVSTQINYDTCEFTFDASWDGYAKTAVFYSDTTVKKSIALVGNECVIPWENLVNSGVLFVGVFGVKGTSVIPTNFAEQRLLQGAYVGADPTQPTNDIYLQLISDMNAFRDAEAARVVVENARVIAENARETQEGVRQANTATAIQNAVNATALTNTAIANANTAAERANTATADMQFTMITIDGGGATEVGVYDDYNGGVA